MKKISIIIAVIVCSMPLFAQQYAGKNHTASLQHAQTEYALKAASGKHILLNAVYCWKWDAGTMNWSTPDTSQEINFDYDGFFNNTAYKTCNDTNLNDSGLYIRTYNANNYNTSTVYQTKTTPSTYWVNITKDTTTYDANNNLTSYLYQIYNGLTWEGYYKYNYQFDGNNNLLTYLYQSHSGTGLVPDSLNTYSYNTNNYLTGYIAQSWSGSNWLNKIKDTLTYNAKNNITSQILQTMQGVVWIDSLLVLNTYDVNNNLTSDVTQKWNGSAWVNFELHNYTYDANNNRTSTLYQKWNFTSWLNFSRNIYTYDVNNNLVGNLYQTWSGSAWTNKNQYTNSYDVNNNLLKTIYQTWSGSAWINNNLKAWTFDANHLVLSYTNKNFNSTGSNVASGDSIYYYYYAVSGINTISGEQGNIVVYPNPNNGNFAIRFGHAELVSACPKIVEIYNVMGQKVISEALKQVQGDNEFNISEQPNGIYFYRVLKEDGSVIGEGKLIIKK